MNKLPSLFSHHLDSFFNDSFIFPIKHFGLGSSFGSINIKDKKDRYELIMNVPGLSEDDISLDVKDGVLLIKANREMEKEETAPKEGEGFIVQEFSSVALNRSFTIPREVNTEEIDAKLEKGRLIVTLPKSKTANLEPKKILIKK